MAATKVHAEGAVAYRRPPWMETLGELIQAGGPGPSHFAVHSLKILPFVTPLYAFLESTTIGAFFRISS
jgi:hypothetical protein